MNEDFVYCGLLDHHSRRQLNRHNLGFSSEIVLGAVLKEPLGNSDDTIAKSILINTARYLLGQDRMLSVVVFDENKETPYWAGINRIVNVQDHVISIDKSFNNFDTQVRRLEYICSRYSSGQTLDLTNKSAPLWKLILSKGNDQNNEPDILILVMSHVLGDGKSARRVLLKVLDYIYSENSGNSALSQEISFDIQPKGKIPLPIDKIYDTRPTLFMILNFIILTCMLSKYFPNWIFKLSSCQEPAYSEGNQMLTNFKVQRKLDVRVIVIPSLYAAAKSSQINFHITVHSLLSRIIHVAIFETCLQFITENTGTTSATKRRGRSTKMRFYSRSAASLKCPTDSLVNNFVGGYQCREELSSDTNFWDSVKTYHQLMRSPYAHREALAADVLIDYVGGPTAFHTRLFTQSAKAMKAGNLTYFSNLGSFISPEDDDDSNKTLERVSRVFFYHPISPAALQTSTYAVSLTKTSDTVLTFSWRRDTVSKEWVDHFERVLLRAVNRIVSRADRPDLNISFGSLVS